MTTAVVSPPRVATFVCPTCGAIARREASPGVEVVAAYCPHRGDAAGVHLVRMEPLDATGAAAEEATP